jgi:hypothetical protein
MSNGIFVKFPNSKLIRRFSSQRAVARMLSGNGTESGGLRTQISDKALNGLLLNSNNVVRNNALYG